MITSVLVANRGEIARRVFRTCRALGLSTVAVYSDADADSPHVREADSAVRLPGTAPADTYLRADLLVAAAVRAGADSIHPGYGFLSENADFARAVQDAGLTWIGPPVEAIAAMGSKVAAKALMSAAGVPVLAELAPDTITDADLPVLIKASAGGGGRGMRVVRQLADLPRELDAARAEAASAFGDPTVFCEAYLPTGRHIEVQVLADEHGTIWTVGERECSIQRRHQKVVEEAPSPLVERIDGLRAQLFDAARAATEAIAYTGAGTVEFLADERGRFYFLEMNTRLQVEHPVTECTTGLDLVALQLAVADGGRLAAGPPATHGHAIEVRLYAEEPSPTGYAPTGGGTPSPTGYAPTGGGTPSPTGYAPTGGGTPTADWRPQSGTLHGFAVPGVSAEFATGTTPAGIRLDSGVQDGTVVGVHYDPMLAKVISWAPDRAQAARALSHALARSTIHGVRTNRDLLVNVLRHKAFLDGDTDTAFFERHGLAQLAVPLGGERAEALSALAAALALDAAARESAPVLRAVPTGWRNVVSQPQWRDLDGPGGPHHVTYRQGRDGLSCDLDEVHLLHATAAEVVLEDAGVRRAFAVRTAGEQVFVDSALGAVTFGLPARFTDPAEQVAAGSLLAPMPGTVTRISPAVGDAVRAGEPILWLEAMKMQHQINAPADGTVAELPVQQGQQVDVGAVLAVLDPAEQQQEPV